MSVNEKTPEPRPDSHCRQRLLSLHGDRRFDRWIERLLVCAFALLFGLACGSDARSLPDQVTGVITEIGRNRSGAIQRFSVRQGTRSFDVRIDPRRDYGFDLEHLEQHLTSDWPVTVRLEPRGGALYAVEILDAQSRP